ncbi:hypothetical protein [Mycolicibacterium hippocampi]|uniref:Uncharacterized protein n=1 Tax=Mycolicibacterium hippocampi TaxID=659824 RepID=A0A7I9ZQ41_9MYCO|nr:hypothetical protein [Mycolicibacterium hippocampi]GFH03144.1 hypothetical protein MHIP_36270 [Mycolicibacterium hippocampi]
MKPKSTFEGVALTLITLVAGLLLVLQLKHNGWSVDVWVVVLFAIGALPWFWRTFESVTFPGGGLTMREIKDELDEQQRDIRAVEFLVSNHLTPKQQEVLRRFATPEPFRVDIQSKYTLETANALGAIGRAGLIEGHDGTQFDIQDPPFQDYSEGDLKTAYRLTSRGRQYLRLLDKTA